MILIPKRFFDLAAGLLAGWLLAAWRLGGWAAWRRRRRRDGGTIRASHRWRLRSLGTRSCVARRVRAACGLWSTPRRSGGDAAKASRRRRRGGGIVIVASQRRWRGGGGGASGGGGGGASAAAAAGGAQVAGSSVRPYGAQSERLVDASYALQADLTGPSKGSLNALM